MKTPARAVPQQLVPPPPAVQSKLVYNNQSPNSPLHLSDALVLRSGGTGTVNAAAMMNPMGQDMEILEIKFEVSGSYIGGDQTVFGGTISCEFNLGLEKVTNAAIPVWNFGRAENLDGETKYDTSTSTAYQSYSWRLPRPLFIPAGAVLTPNFTHTGFVPDTVNVRIGYSCRVVTVRPKTIYLPWVAKYASKVFNPMSAAGVDTSGPLDLVNPNQEPVYLQRFVGRTLCLPDTGVAASEDAPSAFGAKALQLRITDSYGRPVVRDYTAFRQVFGALTRSWELSNGARLDPAGFYIVKLKKDALTLNPEYASGQAFISMVGWREVPV